VLAGHGKHVGCECSKQAHFEGNYADQIAHDSNASADEEKV
jgi:hypothetical protein